MNASSTICMNTFKASASNSTKKVGRPINCFLAFRLDKYREISARSPGLNHRDISKIIAKWWKEASEAEKTPYRAIAAKAKVDHARKYPDYKYQPVKKSDRKVRPYRRREDAATREQKAIAKKRLLKEWLGEDDDCKSETSFSSSSSSSTYRVNPQPHYNDMPIKVEPIQMDDAHFSLPSSLYQPMFLENLIYNYDIKFSDTIPDCIFASTQASTMNNIIPVIPALDYVDTPNYVNLQMLSIDDTLFKL